MNSLLVKNGVCVLPGRTVKADVLIEAGTIVQVGKIDNSHFPTINAEGLYVLPGIIDSQVHFREPGLTHKEDIESGSRAAALGGVTSFYEMPNTNPSTIKLENLREKIAIANEKSHTNFGFFIGASDSNIDDLIACQSVEGCVGIKIFLGSSTGSLLLNNREKLKEIFCKTKSPIAIHAEDESILQERISIRNAAKSALEHPHWRSVESSLSATKMIVELAKETNRKIHILHITSKDEIDYLAKHKSHVTLELTPQHLTLYSPDCYEDLGTYAQMNPPIREKSHFDGLWAGLQNGVADVIGSDHAPHTRSEKDLGYPKSPSGMPGVQTLVPIMLNHVNEGRLSLERFVDMASTRPAQIYGKNKGRIGLGADGDLTIVSMSQVHTITHSEQASKCGWTPFHGMKVKGVPVYTVVMGKVVMAHGKMSV
jgi:dihydroorotase